MDDVPVAKIKDFQDKLQDFFLTRKESLLTAIREKKAVDDSISGDLKAATEEFKLSYK
jgi:F-type H+-transporting ATPase subunit alpha